MISIICAVKNGLPYLENTIKSFLLQNLKNKELIIVCSKSDDGTENVLRNLDKNKNIKIYYDHKSKNKFDSINLGIKIARGDIIGLLHADDVFYSSSTLNKINKFINFNKIDGVYGNILIVKRNSPSQVTRRWIENPYFKNIIDGWMPAHTSLFLKKKIFKQLNYYSSEYKISSDYDFIFKLFKNNIYKIRYMNMYIAIMRDGGDSSVKISKKLLEDYSILKKNNLGFRSLLFKTLYKIPQFFHRSKINLNQYLKKILFQELSYVDSFRNVDTNKPKIYLALNLATSLYLIKKKISFKNLVFWKDGLMSYWWDKNNMDKNIPGRDLLKNINLDYTKINRIYFIGNINKKLSNFFHNLFFPYKKISFIKLPFLNIGNLNQEIEKFRLKKKSLVILNISSPKQEILAENFFLKKKINIFCLGAAPLMLSGIEMIPPKIFTLLKLEFLWRLRKDFTYRILRIIKSTFTQIYYFKKINSQFILKKYR